MDSARFQSNINRHRTPSESTRECVWKPGGNKTECNGMTLQMTWETVRPKRIGEWWGKNQPAAARNLMPPFPAPRVYGTDPRRQRYVAGEMVQQREDFSSHRDAPLTAPVPFRTTRCTSGKGGECKGTGSRLAPALMLAKCRPVRHGGAAPGAAPATPLGENAKLSLDSRGPSHGRVA